MLRKIHPKRKKIFTSVIFISFVAMISSGFFNMHFQIEEESKLSIAGSSNVNKFVCDCAQTFSKSALNMRISEDGNVVSFDNVVLKIQTKKLDCKHRVMNQDMYKTLQADEHPYISIQLKSVENLPAAPLTEAAGWTDLSAKVIMTIAGESREEMLKIKAMHLGNHRFRFRSDKKIEMTDFGIKPPTAMLGLIKVDNSITINMDLVVSVED